MLKNSSTPQNLPLHGENSFFGNNPPSANNKSPSLNSLPHKLSFNSFSLPKDILDKKTRDKIEELVQLKNEFYDNKHKDEYIVKKKEQEAKQSQRV
jgi:hypothetical protein